MKTLRLLFLAAALLFPGLSFAETPSLPHWSIEVKGGIVRPAVGDWKEFYGKSYLPVVQGSLAYKIARQVEVGVGAGAMRARGKAHAPLHGFFAGDVTYELYPLNLFILARGVVNESQWLVPYVGGGYTRMLYRQRIENQETATGAADGFHARAGLQISLDGIDRIGANNLAMEFGVNHTYFFVEAEYTRAITRHDSVNLGGTALLGGLLFEF